ncbi:hypothetical protein PM082_000289 [Marasmius tenuissimus]|nr:hypothetical protein PM082_000289 [Marasmius tenuissimus]
MELELFSLVWLVSTAKYIYNWLIPPRPFVINVSSVKFNGTKHIFSGPSFDKLPSEIHLLVFDFFFDYFHALSITLISTYLGGLDLARIVSCTLFTIGVGRERRTSCATPLDIPTFPEPIFPSMSPTDVASDLAEFISPQEIEGEKPSIYHYPTFLPEPDPDSNSWICSANLFEHLRRGNREANSYFHLDRERSDIETLRNSHDIVAQCKELESWVYPFNVHKYDQECGGRCPGTWTTLSGTSIRRSIVGGNGVPRPRV